MATRNRNTRRNTADLRTKLEVAQLIIDTLCWAKPTPQQLLTRSHRLRLADVRERTGLTTETMIRRAVGNWLNVEAPVYLQRYDA